ncbi:MAG: alkaline phosphatase family protein [bacterium]|nr:alkaline phosphatase family protein [bacterium]
MRRCRALGLALWAILLAVSCGRAPAPRLFVLGIDGMDPGILQRLIDAGRMPNFAALAQRGRMTPLETTMPPQSPVAWSSFITGLLPEGHGIFDFVHRDAQDLRLFLSTSSVGADVEMELHREGTPFWDLLLQAGIPATIFRVPANFPPSPEPAGVDWTCRCSLRAFAGMGTPDLLGTYGSFTLFTDGDYQVPAGVDGGGDVLVPGGRLEVPGGRVAAIHMLNGAAPMLIEGPSLDGDSRQIEVRLFVDRNTDAVHLSLPGTDVILKAGEWSPWLELDFGRRPGGLGRVAAITRFYLRGTTPLWLYQTPLNLNPRQPMMPISVPAEAAAELAAEELYYTQGMPADTKALESAVFTEAEFLAQVEITLAERERHLDVELAEFDAGLLFFYVHSLDQVSHMLWRATDPTHPGYHADLQPFALAIDDHYVRMDRLLGRALTGLQRDGVPPADVLGLSDHGFAPYARSVNLNRWLVEQGFLVLRQGAAATADLLGTADIDWSATRAYALGLNAVYVNLQGREAQGSVRPAQVAQVRHDVAAALERALDPQNGASVVQQTYELTGAGVVPQLTPDLLIGYARGYRSSGNSAVGRIDPEWLSDNLSAWSGDHCMAAAAVPGVLIASRRFTAPAPALWDIPVSILAHYGVAPPPGAAGQTIWR